MKSLSLTLVSAFTLLLLCISTIVEANERAYQWQGTPITITISVNEELILNFEDEVKVGVPGIVSSSAQIDSLSGKVYITANVPFDRQRLQIARLSDGQRLLIDLTAIEGGNRETGKRSMIDVHFDAPDNTDTPNVSALDALHVRSQMPIPALLTRFAYQSLYSPAHAIEPLPGVARTAMRLDSDIAASAFPLWAVEATPVAAWSLKGFTVTAITLRHLNQSVFELDPRHIAVDAYSISFAFPNLGPRGTDSAINTAFVVTKSPLHQLLPHYNGQAVSNTTDRQQAGGENEQSQ